MSCRQGSCVMAIIGGVLWLGSAIAQESSRGPLFAPVTGGNGASSGSGIGSKGLGAVSESPRVPGGGSAVANPVPGTGGKVPADLLQSRPLGSGESVRMPADPLRGLILRPDQVRGNPPASVAPGERSGSATEWARPPSVGDNRSPSRASGAPADPLGGLLQDSDSLLKFSGPKGDPAGADVKAKLGEEAGSSRQSRSAMPSPGIVVPDLLTSSSGALPLPVSPLPTTQIPTTPPTNASNMGVAVPGSAGSDIKSSSTYRPPAPNFGSRSAEEIPAHQVSQKFSLVERLSQALDGAMQQPLTYVLLLGFIGYGVIAKLRQR